MERSLYASAIGELLRVNEVIPTQMKMSETSASLIVKRAQLDKAKSCLSCILSPQAFTLEVDVSRGPAAIREFRASNVRSEFKANDMLKLSDIWSVAVNRFPAECRYEFDPAQSSTRRAVTAEFEIPSQRRGLRFKGQIYMSLTPSDREQSPGASLAVDGRFGWRRASETEWHSLEAAQVADPRNFNANAADALSECATRVANNILDVP